MATISYKDWKTRIRQRIWVSPGEARNLIKPHDHAFDMAMVELSKWISRAQENNTTIIAAKATYLQCAKSLLCAPNGVIQRVFTIANKEWCDTVTYSQESFQKIECLSRWLLTDFQAPANAGLPALQQGIKFHESSADSPVGRSRSGVYAIYRQRLYLFPWIQSNEDVVIEWDGWKREWDDEDLLDMDVWGLDFEEAVESYVRWKHEAKFGCDLAKARELKATWQDQFADLMDEDRKLTEVRESQECDNRLVRPTSSAELQDDTAPVTVGGSVTPGGFGNIGDYGDPANGTAELDVSNLVKSWDDGKGTFFIVTNGDNQYGTPGNYDARVGAFYGGYIKADIQENRFWPALGNHDWNEAGINLWYTYFTLPNNERYYDFVRGGVHFFILDSDLNEPDGTSPTSKQGEWLKLKLALSTVKWKVVICQDPPYTDQSVDYPGHSYMRWPFKEWGATVVISGDSHMYERYEVDGLPYLVNGAGGAPLASFTSISPSANAAFTKKLYNSDYGAIRGTSTCDYLLLEFFNRAGTLIDSLKIE